MRGGRVRAVILGSGGRAETAEMGGGGGAFDFCFGGLVVFEAGKGVADEIID